MGSPQYYPCHVSVCRLADSDGISICRILLYVYNAKGSTVSLMSPHPVLTLRAFMRRRRIFNSLLGSNNNLTQDKYLRLMAMCIIEISCTIPLCIYVLVYDTRVLPIYEWKGFADLHWHFDRVDQYPIIQWILMPEVQRSFEVNEWIVIGCAILYFLIFGLTAEARVHYLSAFNVVRSLVGLPSTASSQSQRYAISPEQIAK